jgi:hypothetical protein
MSNDIGRFGDFGRYSGKCGHLPRTNMQIYQEIKKALMGKAAKQHQSCSTQNNKMTKRTHFAVRQWKGETYKEFWRKKWVYNGYL